ncbi:MAG: hypothetical protein RBU29_16210 [bacterium]|jgi:hypothetical protein|nr:hypothetical protein [bacterium]
MQWIIKVLAQRAIQALIEGKAGLPRFARSELVLRDRAIPIAKFR